MHLNALLDQNVVALTASRRLAHALRAEYAEHARAQNRLAWRAPRILPWSAWLRQERLEAQTADPSAATRVLTRAQARVLWDDIVSDSRAGRDLLNPASAARLAARSWRRLHEHLIPIERLLESSAAEPRALHEWCTEFARRCASLHAIDEAQLTHWAFSASFAPQERLALVGFDFVPPAMARLIAAWRARRLIVEPKSAGARSNRAVALGAHDAAAELDLCARWARSQVEAGVRSVGVILNDVQNRRDEVRRVFEDVFAPALRRTESDAQPIPVVIAAPAPLTSYPIIDAALLILGLATGGRPAADAGRLLRSPFVGGWQAEAHRRALADVQLREQQLDRWDWFELERWAGVQRCETLELAARRVSAQLRAGFASAPASVWAERFHLLLREAGWPGERTLDGAEHQTLAKFQDALAEFGALDAVTGRLSLHQARARLYDVLNETPFEPETGRAAVMVIDSETSAGMQFEALWAAGLHAERWPAPVNPDPLIPLDLQRAAGIPDATPAGVRERAQQQLSRWLGAARSVVFSWPMHEGEAVLAASPLLADVQMAQPELLVEQRVRTLRQLAFEQRPSLVAFADERAPPLSSEQARGGARTVELQSLCPFRAQAELRLGAAPLARVSLGVEPVDRGALLHRVLFEIWGELGSQQALQSLDDETLEQRVRQCAARHAAQMLRPDTRSRSRLAALEVDSVVRQTLRLLAQERERPPFEVSRAESEQRFVLGGLAITLRADRIDELANGQQLIIDYKLGATHQRGDWLDRTPGRPRRPQLPLYALAHGERVGALAYVVLAPGAVEYRGWSNGAPVGPGVAPYPAGVRIDLGDPTDWEALVHHWRFTLTRLAEQYVAGEARVDPLPHACDYCHLSAFCRIHERAAGERGEDVRDAD